MKPIDIPQTPQDAKKKWGCQQAWLADDSDVTSTLYKDHHKCHQPDPKNVSDSEAESFTQSGLSQLPAGMIL